MRETDRDGEQPSLSAYAGEQEPDAFDEEGSPAVEPTVSRARPRPSFTRWLVEILLTLVAAAVLALAIKSWVLEARQIPSSSMEQTLLVGDRVLVEKLSYRFRAVSRPDVVVFESEEAPVGAIIKRVVAVAGQRIDIRDGAVYVDGQRLEEAYVNARHPDHYDAGGESVVPTGTVFVMGDNRANSNDSRYIGPVLLSSIIGRAFAVYWPLDRLSGL
jgi:signal peptidase I